MLAAGGAGVLAQIGWVEETRDGETALVLPLKVQCTMQQVRAIDDAMAALVKRMEEDRRAASRKRAADPEKARLHAQLEADRRERAARGPVTQGSKANKLDFGANGESARANRAENGIGSAAPQCARRRALTRLAPRALDSHDGERGRLLLHWRVILSPRRRGPSSA